MNKQYSKRRTLFYVLICALILGVLTGYYWLSMALFLLGYIVWILARLLDVENWMKKGVSFEQTPQSGGVFEVLIAQVIQLKKQSTLNKKNYQKLMIRFNKILRSFPYPTIIVNANNEIQWISKRAAVMLNLHRKKDIGIQINNIIRHEGLLTKLKSPELGEYQMTSPQDDNAILDMAISKLNKDVRILSIRDISTKRRLEADRNFFIANASHELRTPLTLIKGYLEILTQDDTLSAETQSAVKNAYHHSQRMSELMTDLLALSEIENSTNSAQKLEIVDISRIIHAVYQHLNGVSAITQSVQIVADAQLKIKGNYYQLHSLVSNLIENSIKYSHPHGNIKIIWHQHKDQAILRITDQGRGIATDALLHLTEPFYRVQHVQSEGTQGNGLGLSIVKQAAIKHNAQLLIESKQGEGSDFQVVFSDYVLEA